MNALDIIAKKRDGKKLTAGEIGEFVSGSVRGDIKDYQVAAWLMACYLRGLDQEETTALTFAMAQSGERLDLSGLPKPWVDKHSTGGVGDKTSLVVLPLLSSAGLTVVKMSGRGLGPTGGTIDKLSSIPGFRFDLTPNELIQQARSVGIALTGQTPDLAPADRIFYALRDTTATVDCIPLIVSSILSKKIAGGADIITLDVKCGSGAFMHSLSRAKELAAALKSTALACGLKLELEITDMSQPLGRCVGNALEVDEAIEVLKGQEKGRFRELCVGLAAVAFQSAGLAGSKEEGYARATHLLDSGAALEKARLWFKAQGAPDALIDNPWSVLPLAPVQFEQRYDGPPAWVAQWDAAAVGKVAMELGAGRHRKEDKIDPSVGIESFVTVGEKVEDGDKLFTVHSRTAAQSEAAAAELMQALRFSSERVDRVPLFLS